MPEHVAYAIETPIDAASHVLELELREAIDEPYLAIVELEFEEADVSSEALLGKDVVIRFGRGDYERRLCGLAQAVRIRPADEPTHSRFRLEVVPALSLLELTRNTRMFQNLSVPEILEQTLNADLSPYSRTVLLDLSAEYPTREYCLQYQESNLAFARRLMAEEGIAFTFDHSAEREETVLTDANAAFARADGAAAPLPFDPRLGVESTNDTEAIVSFERVHDTRTTAIALRDFDFTKPSEPRSAVASGEDAAGVTRERYEHGWGRSASIWGYDEGARQYQEHDAERQVLVRQEAVRAAEIVGQGGSRVCGLAPGRSFELSGHPGIGFDGEWLVTRVLHTSSDREVHDGYRNRFEAIPLAVPHRPASRAHTKPRVPSAQTATVTGPPGEEIHTDEHGRITVQFHWDRDNEADDTSSCWMRVQQKWAGDGWGFLWLPRVGMEVVVQFIDGDPDRPLVTGSVYDADHATPYVLPDEKTKSTIKSNSSPGGGGFNELRFEDKAGSEQIYSHAQKDYNEVIENDHTTLVHHDQTNTVDNDQTQTVHNNQTEDIGNDQTMTVEGNRTVSVEGDYDESVDGTESRTVTGDVTESFAANETRTVGANLTETIGADETRDIGASQTETVGAAQSITVGGSSSLDVAGALVQTVAGGVTLETPASWDVTATGGLNIIAPGGMKFDAAGGWKISAPGGVVQIDAGKDWTGFFWRSSGAFARGVCGVKFERFGATFTYVNTKCGFSGAAMPQMGFKCEFNTAAFGTIGGKISLAGADVHTWGMEMDN